MYNNLIRSLGLVHSFIWSRGVNNQIIILPNENILSKIITNKQGVDLNSKLT